jgi:hypothetical protein
MGNTASVSDRVIEFLGELYVHEPYELRMRVQFRDYLELLLRNEPRIMTYNSFHAHRCACGTFLTCEAPSTEECEQKPTCSDCKATSFDQPQESRKPKIESGSDSRPPHSSRNSEVALGGDFTLPGPMQTVAASQMSFSVRRAPLHDQITSEHQQES